ncbi:MAG: very short patch repair endonuclease [Chloroflexota bacterium]
MDIMKPEQRYLAMAHNRGRTSPERALASALWKHGLRYLTPDGYKSLTDKRLPGNPDVVFPRKRVVLFVDGCFWHGCPACDTGVKDSSQSWQNKIANTKERDQRVTAILEKDGWKVFRVFEHEVRTKVGLQSTAERLTGLLRPLCQKCQERA